jgi:uncharacterized protein YjiK
MMRFRFHTCRNLWSSAALFILALFFLGTESLSQDGPPGARQIRIIEVGEGSVEGAIGLAYLPSADVFLFGQSSHPDSSGVTDYVLTLVSLYGDVVGYEIIDAVFNKPVGVSIDAANNNLLLLSAGGAVKELISVPVTHSGFGTQYARFDIARFGLEDVHGMTIDPTSGDLFILDAVGPRVLHVKRGPVPSFDAAEIFEIDLSGSALGELRGIGFDASSGRLHVLDSERQYLHEIAVDGRLITTRDLSEFDLRKPQSMVFAPSGDLTDDPAEMSLYISNGEGVVGGVSTITEISLVESSAEGAAASASLMEVTYSTPSFLRNIIDTSLYDPPSPDPAGIGYLDLSGNMLISDSEVNEIPSLFTGDNLFEITLGGTLIATSSTTGSGSPNFSREPTGISGTNPINNHIFISDDNDREISEINPGSDGAFGTGDDVVTEFRTTDFSPASNDPEGVAFAPALGDLFVADGLNNEIYRVRPGNNGIFDGTPTGGGDDVVTSFDTESAGLYDPEGLEYDRNSGTLLAVGYPGNLLFEFSVEGALLSTIDISEAISAGLRKPAGLAVAPSSQSPGDFSVYIVDRGIDNNSDPNENDGRVFEMSSSLSPPVNQAPLVDSGSNQSIILPNSADLDGTVVDDGLPAPPAGVTVAWTMISGPGTVTFGNASAVDTTAVFSAEGVYVLRLTAADGELSAFDETTVHVLPEEASVFTVEQRVGASSDDAEELTSGVMQLVSTDLDIGGKTVAMRFSSVGIPSQATIVTAYLLFQADETNTSAASFSIYGEQNDDAPTFSSNSRNITSRAQTAASVTWAPPAWTVVGEMSAAQRTTDFSVVVQELVNRSGWTEQSSLVVIIDQGNGLREAVTFDGGLAGAPLLHVEYIVVPAPTGADRCPGCDGPAAGDGGGEHRRRGLNRWHGDDAEQ